MKKSLKAIIISGFLYIGLQNQLVAVDNQEREEGFYKKIECEYKSSQLLLELLVHIFSFLDQKDFLKASYVCHEWRTAAYIAGDAKFLDLSAKQLDQKDYQVLLNIPFSAFVLDRCYIGDEGVLTLSQATWIKELDLRNNDIRDKGATTIANGNLTSLKLSKNRIGIKGAAAIANGNLSSLTFLDFGGNLIGDEGTTAIANGNLTALTSLNLRSNSIGEDGKTAIANGNLISLISVDLSNNSSRLGALFERGRL